MKLGLSAPYPTRLDSGSPDKSFYVYIKAFGIIQEHHAISVYSVFLRL